MSEKELIEKDLDELAKKQEEEYMQNLERYHWLKENGYILFETITGSMAHGTNTEKSDIDKAFVYILPQNDIYGTEYKDQLKIHKDFMGYEIRRFLELLKKANPTVLELLNSPADCILTKHSAFDILLNQKEKFITKTCENSFYGYAKQQRQKAEGLEKLKNWKVNRVTKRTPLDFCYIIEGYDAIPAKNWLSVRGHDQLFCALSAVNHCRDLYAVFYDYDAHSAFSELIPLIDREEYKARKKAAGETMGFGYKGIAFEDSHDIRLSNIPFEQREKSIGHLSYNKDGYHKHCIDYKRYQTWLENKNENRWVEIQGHGQSIDGKNMMHFMRLIYIAREIAEGKGITIRRHDAQDLLKIRKGEIPLQELFDKSEGILNEMKLLFQTSNLPEEISQEFIHNTLVAIRTDFYKNMYPEILELDETNPFTLKAYGGDSELYHFIRGIISSEGDFSNIMEGIDYKSNRWPKTINKETKKIEKVSLENFSVFRIYREKISVMCGGDWQVPIQFDIVMWQDTLATINIKNVKYWDEGFSKEEFFKRLKINTIK